MKWFRFPSIDRARDLAADEERQNQLSERITTKEPRMLVKPLWYVEKAKYFRMFISLLAWMRLWNADRRLDVRTGMKNGCASRVFSPLLLIYNTLVAFVFESLWIKSQFSVHFVFCWFWVDLQRSRSFKRKDKTSDENRGFKHESDVSKPMIHTSETRHFYIL